MNTKENAVPKLATAGNKSIVKVQKKLPYRKSNAVNQLEVIANNKAKAKNPNIPADWLATRKYRDDSANNLTKCIMDFIKLTGGQAERISNTGRQITQCKNYENVVGFQRSIVNTQWIPGTGTNGVADISATIKELSVKIEVKYGTDRQSQVQKQYQWNIERAGGIYVIANSFEQFYNWYNLKFSTNGK